MIKNIRELVYIPDYLAVLCLFNKNRTLSVNELHFTSQIAYSSLHLMKKVFVEKGWVTIEHVEGKHIVSITESGEELANIIYSLIDKLGLSREDLFNLKLGRKHKVIENEGKESSKTYKETEEDGRDKQTIDNINEEIGFPGQIYDDTEATVNGEKTVGNTDNTFTDKNY
jgi:DNA-binding PadR family transcriptional regulator